MRWWNGGWGSTHDSWTLSERETRADDGFLSGGLGLERGRSVTAVSCKRRGWNGRRAAYVGDGRSRRGVEDWRETVANGGGVGWAYVCSVGDRATAVVNRLQTAKVVRVAVGRGLERVGSGGRKEKGRDWT